MRRLPYLGRWWLAATALWFFIGLAFAWQYGELERQERFMRCVVVVLSSFFSFLLWALLASRWQPRLRWTVFGGTALLIGFCALALRIKGVTGDLIPIVEWRWSNRQFTEVKKAATAPGNAATLTNRYPQFLGPNRDAILPGPALARDWKQSPPKELWRQAVGSAWSGFAVEGHRAITQEQRGDDEFVVCYDVLTGATLWMHSDKSRYATTIAGEGPRATPTISSNRVFTMGGAGLLNCLDLATGKVLWKHDTMAEFNAKVPEWGVACSPLVTERGVFVTVGGNNAGMVAFDPDSGAKIWAGGHDGPHWCSPARATLDGTSQIIVFSDNVSSYDEQSGKVLWQHPWRSPFPHVTAPLVLSSNRVLVSQGYGGGSELLQITRTNDRWKATQLWKSIRLKSKFANLIYLDGHVYGLDDGALVCLEINSGDMKWKGDRYGHGQMILVAGLLLLTSEGGDIVLVEPAPAEPRELTRFKVFGSKTWNPPALAGDLLLVRTDREAACLRLPTVNKR
jgi:outer membrane protein assembly factor BamB